MLGVSLGSPELARLDGGAVSSISEVVGYMDELIDYLISRRRYDAKCVGILSAMLMAFFGVVAVFIVNVLAENYVTRFFIEHPGSSLIYLGFLSAFSALTGVIVYFYAKKRYVEVYIPWKKTLSELRETIVKGEVGEKNIAETTLLFMDQANTWLSEMVKYKDEEALTYGLATFFITALISAYSPVGLPVALLVGIFVWLYFRHEKREEAAQQIRRFEAWRKRFEEGKEAFLKGITEGRG
jgi:hypothetical protein